MGSGFQFAFCMLTRPGKTWDFTTKKHRNHQECPLEDMEFDEWFFLEFLEIAINQWHWYFLWNAMNSWLEWISFWNSWGYHWHILVDWLWVTGVFYYLDYWGLWVGLMENLQETIVLTIKKKVFSCKISPKPIHWYWGLGFANRH